MTIASISQVIAKQLDASADTKTKQWWESYMKGALPFRGVPMATIRRTVHSVWGSKGLGELPVEDRIEIALAQFKSRYSEDKVAGILMLAERILDDLETSHHVLLARPFEEGLVNDWSTCDWYCVKALGPFVDAADRKMRSKAIAGWSEAESLWQRRAAAVSFVNYAPQGDRFFEGFSDLVIRVCERNVNDPARFSQTSVGWVLRELSKAVPEKVSAFVERHRDVMSREAVKSATKHL